MSDASRPQAKTTQIPIEIWAGILVIIGFTAVIFLKDDVRSGTSVLPPITNVSKETTSPPKDIYGALEGKTIAEAVTILEKYSKKAQRIIPFFPSFPKIWLLPPRDKGDFSSLGERHCIEFMELLFPGHRFPKIRPEWLKNTKHDTKRNLELDGYCEDLSLAIEYNGIQHYIWPNFTSMTRDEFMRQRERDQLKEEVCIRRNICLIRIPYTVALERIPLAIYAKLLDAVPELKL